LVWLLLTGLGIHDLQLLIGWIPDLLAVHWLCMLHTACFLLGSITGYSSVEFVRFFISHPAHCLDLLFLACSLIRSVTYSLLLIGWICSTYSLLICGICYSLLIDSVDYIPPHAHCLDLLLTVCSYIRLWLTVCWVVEMKFTACLLVGSVTEPAQCPLIMSVT
jgi:hypothetical protein